MLHSTLWWGWVLRVAMWPAASALGDLCDLSNLSYVSSTLDGYLSGSVRVQLSVDKEGNATNVSVFFILDEYKKETLLVPTETLPNGAMPQFAGALELNRAGAFHVDYAFVDSAGTQTRCIPAEPVHEVNCSAGYDRKGDQCKSKEFCSSISLRKKGAEPFDGNGPVRVVSTDVLVVNFSSGTGKSSVKLLPREAQKQFSDNSSSVDVDLGKEGVLAGQTYVVLASRGASEECFVLKVLQVGCAGGSSPREGICVSDEGRRTQIIIGICLGSAVLLSFGMLAFYIYRHPEQAKACIGVKTTQAS